MDVNPAIADAALALRQARSSRQPIPPISATHGIGSIDDAYAIAGLNAAALIEAGHRPSGKKIGLTSTAVQKQLGVDQPDFGVLFADMEFLSRDVVPMTRLIQPKVEAEIAFVAAREIGTYCAPRWCEFLASLAYALPAIEIVDSAIADWKITLFDTIADNASAGRYVLGDQPVAIGSVQLANVAMELRVGGQVSSTGKGSLCLDHPLRAAFWLATTLASLGQPIRAGEVILSGALGPMVPVKTGDEVVADFGAFGTVCCKFE
ncbi:MAG TPA: fumarylacetoacetate hydrolase family protein [Candidatus Margulisiibacteriota bacterium]|nr:fumarylacetoacetate hydrolase family protein [Candidatus Margulisiibacteriota bacterium]